MVQKLSNKMNCHDCGCSCVLTSEKLLEVTMAKKRNPKIKFVCNRCHFYHKFSTLIVDHETGETKGYRGIFPENFRSW
jgi:RNase P subunit RPR2